MDRRLNFRVLSALVSIYSLISLQWNWPNLGNDLTPRIFISWAMLIACTAWCWGQAFNSGKLLLNKSFALFLSPPITISLFSLFGPTGSKEYYPFLSFFCFFFGSLFIIGLIQLQLNKSEWEKLGWVITLGTILLSFFALMSPLYFNVTGIFSLLPIPMTVNQAGFQQPNLFASYLSTNIALIYWLIVSNDEKRTNLKNNLLLVTTFILSFTLFCTGSRAGLVGGILSFTLLLVWSSVTKKESIFFNFSWALSIITGLVLAILFLNEFHPDRSVSSRLAQLLAEMGGNSSRLPIWRVSIEIWLDHPWVGIGVGKFTEFYTDYYVRLAYKGVKLTYEQNIDHPHCELLLWLVETGLIGAFFILGPILLFITYILRKGKLASLGWFAVLIPMGFHTFVEFPFHSSGAHWLLYGFVIATGFRSEWLKTYFIELGTLGLKICRITILSILSIPILILFQTAYTSKLALTHMFNKDPLLIEHLIKWSQSPEFNHPILGRLSNDLFMSNTVPLIVSSGDTKIISTWTPVIENLSLRWQNNMIWQSLAICYLSNKDIDKLDQLIYKLRILNPQMADQITAIKIQAGLKNP